MKILPGLIVLCLALSGCSDSTIPRLVQEAERQVSPPPFPDNSAPEIPVIARRAASLIATSPSTVTYACDWKLIPPIYYRVTGLEEAPTPVGPWSVVTNIPVPFVNGMMAKFIRVTNAEYPNGYPSAYATNVIQTFSCTWVSTNVDRLFLRTFAR